MKNAITIKGEVTVKGVQFGFVRRRYGKSAWFTWLHFKDENNAWQPYKGDPWNKRAVPVVDLERIADELKKSVAPEIELCEVCEMFDVYVLNQYACFALGSKPELNAGLRGFTMTPWFDTMSDLYVFCQRNISQFRNAYQTNPNGPAPDATMWI